MNYKNEMKSQGLAYFIKFRILRATIILQYFLHLTFNICFNGKRLGELKWFHYVSK